MEFTILQLLILVFMYVFHLGPWIFVSSQGKSLAELTEQGRNGRAISGDGVGQRRGESGGNGEGLKPHLMVVLARRERVGVGLSAVRGGRRWLCSGAAALCWP